eukprot:Clim_evm46s243 gene=Clim_evmTU46s243
MAKLPKTLAGKSAGPTHAVEETSTDGPGVLFEPFVRHEPDWDVWEYFRTFICMFTLLPIRILGIAFCLTLASLLAAIAAIGIDIKKYEDKPLPMWRKGIFTFINRILARACLFFFGCQWIEHHTVDTLNVDGRIIARAASSPKQRPPLIISNHLSYLDILVFMVVYNCSFVAQDSVGDLRIVGKVARGIKCLFVGGPNQSGQSVTQRINERAQAITAEPTVMPRLLVFPEGTTENGRAWIRFRSGAFVGGHAVQPVVLQFPYGRFSPSWESVRTPYHWFRMLTQFHNRVKIIEMPPYVPNEEELDNAKLYADGVCKAMCQIGRVKAVNATRDTKLKAYHPFLLGQLTYDEAQAIAIDNSKMNFERWPPSQNPFVFCSGEDTRHSNT